MEEGIRVGEDEEEWKRASELGKGHSPPLGK
jgi:hypothetical protein